MTRETGFRWVLLGTMATFAAMFVMTFFPYDTQRALLTEGGLIETLSVIGYVICIALMFVLWPVTEVGRRWYFPVMLALFAGRELDLDKIPFTEGLLKARQYTGDTVPTGELIWSSLILVAIIVTVLILIIRETRGFFSGLFSARPACYAALVGVAFIGAYKTIDGAGRKLAPYGIQISDSLNDTIQVVEEIGELGIPVMFSIGICLAAARRRRMTNTARNDRRA